MTTKPPRKAEALIEEERQLLGEAYKIRFFPMTVARSSGSSLWDIDGNEYIDAMGGASVAAIGYQNPLVRGAIDRVLDKEWFAVSPCFATEATVALARRLVELVPGSFPQKVWYGLSGSEAMDCVAKLAPVSAGRRRLVSFIGGFAGMTIGASAISGHPAHAATIGAGHVTKAPYPNPYRCPWGPCEPQQCSLRCLNYLEAELLSSVSPADDTAAIIIEAIQADNGVVVPPDNYLPALRDLCNKHGIYLVFDEVKTGLGRTGTMFAFEHAGIVPDAVVLGKALGGGLPLSAVVARAEILDVAITTNTTMGGSPMSCAASLAVLDVIESEGLVEKAQRLGAYLFDGLNSLVASHELVGDVRGKGLELGVEFVLDRATKDPAPFETAQVAYRCFELGLVVGYSGSLGNVLEFSPPLVLTEAEADFLLEIVDRALSDVEGGRFDASKLEGFAGW